MKKLFFYVYPILVIIVVPILLLYKHAQAGVIRKIEISQDRPAFVRLAFGRSTAISFLTRPEKVVPGSPASIEVNFLQKDITVRPLSSKPGNLIVYTKSGRYVILFLMGTESTYDDVVSVTPTYHQKGISLIDQSFRVEKFTVDRANVKSEISGYLSTSEKTVELNREQSKFQKIECEKCKSGFDAQKIRISCKDQIKTINCFDTAGKFTLSRGSP